MEDKGGKGISFFPYQIIDSDYQMWRKTRDLYGRAKILIIVCDPGVRDEAKAKKFDC